MEQTRYRISCYRMKRIAWLEWDEELTTERVKTKAELDIMVECILEDASIQLAFYEDVASGKITHIKAGGKPFNL